MERTPGYTCHPEAFTMPTLVLESGARETKLGAPYRDSSVEVTTTFFAPLRPGEGSGAEARGILGELDPFKIGSERPSRGHG